MAHQIEEFEGQASFVSAREDAWHKLGTVVPSELTAEEALEFAHLAGWNVRKEPIYVQNADQSLMLIDDKFATVRTHPYTQEPDVLGVVGRHYSPIQNEDHAGLLNALVDESGAIFQTAGSLRGGKETFITMKLPETIKIGGVDGIDTYIAGLNSHDGSKSFQFLVTPIRIVCANTQAMAIASAHSRFSIRHTKSGADGIIQQARETLSMTFNYLDAFQQEAEKLVQQSFTDTQFDQLIQRLYPTNTEMTDRVFDNQIAHQDALVQRWVNSDTMNGIQGTRWGAYQAVTEYLDHYVKVAGKDGETAQIARATNVVNGYSDDLKIKAFSYLARA